MTLVEDRTDHTISPGRPRLTVVLLVVIALAVVASALAGGYLWGHRARASSTVSVASVDAGFARDMSVHHRQAISMAGYTRDHTTDVRIRSLAYDIETQQDFEIGEMQGWLDAWGLPSTSTSNRMSWMAGHTSYPPNALMPGMATPGEIDKLETLTGAQLDVDFLQLMLRHHQGGLPMAQYAAEHASTPYVRNLAQKMANAQQNEIIEMEQLLRDRGAAPLAPPPAH